MFLSRILAVIASVRSRKTGIALLCIVAMGFLLGVGTIQAATVEKEGNTASAIRNLEVNGVFYDVVFVNQSPAAIYSDPPVFDFNSTTQAQNAVNAVNAALNAEGGIKLVNPADPVPKFRVGFWFVEPSGTENPYILVWEGDTGEVSNEVWNISGDPNVSPFFTELSFADFTVIPDAIDNQPPVANPGGPYNGLQHQPVSFDGTGSSDADGSIVTYSWAFGDNAFGSGPTPSHTYGVEQEYFVTLTVTDDDGDSHSASTTVNIGEADAPPDNGNPPPGDGNQPPVANPGGPYFGLLGQPVSFDGTGSGDPDGSIATYLWAFGDGGFGDGPTPSHTYQVEQEYVVTLTVTDDKGDSHSAPTTVNILPEGASRTNDCKYGVIEGGEVDEITVDGRTCFINNVNVTGNITVNNSESILIVGASVGGQIDVSQSRSVTIAANTVTRKIKVDRSEEVMMLYNSSQGDNSVNRNIFVSIVKNIVGGNLLCLSNIRLDSRQNEVKGEENCQ